MKKFLLVLIIALWLGVSARAQSTFSDVPDNHWAAAAVKRLVEAGIIVGRPATAINKTTTSSIRKTSANRNDRQVEKNASKNVVWGKTVNGLQAGLRFVYGVRSYSPEEVISFDYLIHNVSPSSIDIDLSQAGADWYYSTHIANEDGTALTMEDLIKFWEPARNIHPTYKTVTLSPNQIYKLPQPYGINLGNTVHDDKSYPTFEVSSGSYLVSLSSDFRQTDPKNHTWTGSLKTGQLLLKVVDADQ